MTAEIWYCDPPSRDPRLIKRFCHDVILTKLVVIINNSQSIIYLFEITIEDDSMILNIY